MKHAERCPICTGSGKYRPCLYNGSSCELPEQICHGCGGKGWVEIEDGIYSVPVYTPNAYPINPWPTIYWGIPSEKGTVFEIKGGIYG